MFSLAVVLSLANASVSAGTADPDAVVRCVREDVTGSLARTRRVCHTVGEWRKITSSSNDEVRRISQPGNLNDKNG